MRPGDPVPVEEQVGLALRAYRREQRLSQRGLAERTGVPQATIARIERSASSSPLATVLSLLSGTGYSLAVVDVDGWPVTAWDTTDLLARDRSGRRFPANRQVHRLRVRAGDGPRWWLLHEFLGTGACGPQPEWTAEGFTPPPGTRFGKKPRPRKPGDPTPWWW